MKNKIISIILCMAVLVSFVACSNEKKNSNKKASEYEGTIYDTKVSLPEYKYYTAAESMMSVDDEKKKKIDYIVMHSYQDKCDFTNSVHEDRAIVKYDIVNVDITGMMDGQVVESASATNHMVAIGAKDYIDGFEDGLIGANPGDVVSLNLIFPEGYQITDEAGELVDVSNKNIDFEVKINYIAGITDEFIKDNEIIVNFVLYTLFYNTEKVLTKEAYDNAVLEGLKLQSVVTGAVKCLAEETKVSIDEDELKAFIEKNEESYKKSAEENEMSLEELMTFYGYESLAQYEEYLTQAFKNSVMLMAVVREEGITTDKEEYDAIIDAQIYLSDGAYENAEAYEKVYDKQSTVDEILYGKAYRKLASYVTAVPDKDAKIQPEKEED